MFFNLFSTLGIFKQEGTCDIPAVTKDLGFYNLKTPLYDMNGEARVHLNLNLQREVQTNYQMKNNITSEHRSFIERCGIPMICCIQ